MIRAPQTTHKEHAAQLFAVCFVSEVSYIINAGLSLTMKEEPLLKRSTFLTATVDSKADVNSHYQLLCK